MPKKKILAHVTIPITTSVHTSVEVEIDDALEGDERRDAILDAAFDCLPYFRLSAVADDPAEYVELGEEVGTHRHLNRGNVCCAVVPEATVDDEESLDEGEEEDAA